MYLSIRARATCATNDVPPVAAPSAAESPTLAATLPAPFLAKPLSLPLALPVENFCEKLKYDFFGMKLVDLVIVCPAELCE